MLQKEILNKYTLDEIADAFVLTERLSRVKQKEANNQLNYSRRLTKKNISDKERIVLKILQLKFQIEDYIEQGNFNTSYSFGYFLKQYISILNKKRKEFAEDISIKETELSQLINKHRMPNDQIFVKLEIHSNAAISALSWHKLVEIEREFLLQNDKKLRRDEKNNISNKISFKLK
jgi:plasmid maintenance system antidote protein VapI